MREQLTDLRDRKLKPYLAKIKKLVTKMCVFYLNQNYPRRRPSEFFTAMTRTGSRVLIQTLFSFKSLVGRL